MFFEAKPIQRMEMLVLSTLHWKMNPETPLSFLDHITRRLGLKNRLCCEFLKRCESILLCIISDSRFTRLLPPINHRPSRSGQIEFVLAWIARSEHTKSTPTPLRSTPSAISRSCLALNIKVWFGFIEIYLLH
ncbi:unnamed protein product [Camellia sinensis]